MKGLSRHQALEELRASIQSIEKRTPFEGAETSRLKDQEFALPGAGMLHEVFTDGTRNAGASLGFALAASHGRLTPQRPAILVVQAAGESQEKGILYGGGIRGFGIDPELVVLCRPETPTELLWAIEEAIACRAVAAVIADVGSKMRELDFTASRRLSLRAAGGGSSVFLLRYGTEREASAARFRWKVEPIVSADRPFDPRAPGQPRWRVLLEKGRLGSKREPLDWMLDWTEDGFALVKPQIRTAPVAPRAAPVSGALSTALGDRLPEAS